MALKKSELYSSLWQSCDELRGGMDASQYKDYVLTLLFMKFVTDKYAGHDGDIIEIPKGGSFSDMVAAKGSKDIGERIDKIIDKFAGANGLKGVIDNATFNDEEKLGKGRDMVDRLSKLVGIFESLDFSSNRAEGDDLLGDAYEYLMRHFATDSGKSKGQFYTPAEVSRIMAMVIGIGEGTRRDQTIYDPTCGSGSLLLRAADQAPRGLTIYGQENDVSNWALAKMNMYLHGNAAADLRKGNTLSSPLFKAKDGGLERFDFAVANPPFSTKSWTNGLDPEHDQYHRFDLGVPPAKNGDFAFLLHLVRSLKGNGKGAIILPHGVLYRGNREADIRRKLIERGLIKGVIGLPSNLFYGTGIPACIVVIDKEKAQGRTGIFMIDASRGLVKDGNKNRLREQDIHKIVDVFIRQVEITKYSRMVSVAEIASPANDYNLNISRYIDSSEPEDIHNLDAHLQGGIPETDLDALEDYWIQFRTLRKELFEPFGRCGYSRAKVESRQVRALVLKHKEFIAFSGKAHEVFERWRNKHEAQLKAIKKGTNPRTVIEGLAEDLLVRFAALPLIDKYDLYQKLMDYWSETMQDDVFLISSDGWIEAAKPRPTIENKERKIKEAPDLVVGDKKLKMDLIPPPLIVARYFSKEQAEISVLELKQEAAQRELEEFVEEHPGEEGLLEDAKSDKGKVTKTAIGQRLKDIGKNKDFDEEKAALKRCLELLESELKATRVLNEAQANLDIMTLAKYTNLKESDIKALVIGDKWLTAIGNANEEEVRRPAKVLTARVSQLEERYKQPLPEIENEVDEFAIKVRASLKRMGFAT